MDRLFIGQCHASAGSGSRQAPIQSGHDSVRPRFSQDGQWLIVGGKGRSRIGSSMTPADVPSGTSYNLSFDGQILLTYNSDGVIGLVSAESNKTLAQIDAPHPASHQHSLLMAIVFCAIRQRMNWC